MLIRCLWTTTLPWIVLSQTYYMNFVFNNNGYMSRERHEVVSDGTQNSKWVDIDEEPLEINSMEHPHMERISYDDWASKETPSKDWPSKDLASNDWASRESQESYQSVSNTDEVTQIVVTKHNHTKQKVNKITANPTKVQTTSTPDIVYVQEFPPEIVAIEKVPKEHTTERLTTERHTTERHTTERHTTERHKIKQYISKEYIQKEHIPKEHIPKEYISKDHIPKEHIPKEHIPKEHIPKEHIPKEHIPKEHTTKKHTTKKPTTEGVPKFETTPTEKVQELTTETNPENMLIDIIEDSGEGQRQKETDTPAGPKETKPEGEKETTPVGGIETTLGDGAPDTTDTSKKNTKVTDTTDDDTSKETTKVTDTTDDTSKENTKLTDTSDDTSKETKKVTDTTDDDTSKETTKVTDTTDDNTSKETTKWKTVTPHPPDFFKYPGAKCHEEMDLHELFGISLERDRGIPSKVFCEFSNSWGGPWHLMTRIELPSRVHMRHWFFGYLTDDYKDMNINFLALAHIMNSMRIAMLIIGQDNNDQLVYNLYDDVVISGFNDLFMLRKAELVEANTTDLLFVSVGDVITTFSGRNRSCPFHVIGGWWGFNQWRPTSQYFCVFPVDRDVKRPGYMAIFIKPNPFAINNTALYENVITTRRPWVPTVDARLMEQANNNQKVYRQLKDNDFVQNKAAALAELERRSNIYKDFEKDRFREKGQR